MKFEWVGNTPTGGSALSVEPSRYDAVPFVHELLIDGRPRVVNPDRLAVAATLAFGHESSGEMEFPFPIMPATAEAIQAFLRPTWVALSPLDFVPKALPIGSTRLHVTVDSSSTPRVVNEFDRQRTIHFDLRRSDLFSGQLMSLDRHVVVSNAWLFGDHGSAKSLKASLAVAVLFAESLNSDAIVFPQLVNTMPQSLEGISALLEACRLGLEADAGSPDMINSAHE